MLPCALYLLVVKGIVNGVAQRRDKIWLRYQQHALLDQKLCLGHVDRNREDGEDQTQEVNTNKLGPTHGRPEAATRHLRGCLVSHVAETQQRVAAQ